LHVLDVRLRVLDGSAAFTPDGVMGFFADRLKGRRFETIDVLTNQIPEG
jgi:hypothetical protein